ncbi:MAG TPA: oligosaccharide flippase family protein [Bacteroidia bacterium]|nr:oligosaccharide flippase family protein [Bacteroidia bacterium]
MGIIERQATRNAIYSYMGAGLGFVTVLWMSYLLTPSENGAIAAIAAYAFLFSQFANLGFTTVTVRFFPYFKDKDKGHNGFLFYAIIISLIGFLISWLVFLFLKPYLIERSQEKSQLFVSYLFYLMPLIFFTVFFNIFDTYLRACYSSVIGSLTKEVIQRICIIGVLIVYYFKLIELPVFMFMYFFFTCLPTLLLVFYIMKQNEWHIKPVRGFMSKSLRTEMIKLGFYSILAGGAGAIVLNLDSIMVNDMLGEEKSGVYRIAFYFGSIILIPARSIYRITSSIVAERFKTNDLKEISKLYNQACNNQLTIGLLLFIGIWTNIDNIIHLLPAAYSSGKYVILIVSAGYVVEMGTGINQVIIVNSKYYRYDALLVFLLVGVTVLTNYIFIPLYGIIGSAIATALTVVFANAARFILLYVKFRMQPYDKNTWKLIIISIVAFLPGYFLPDLNYIYLDIAVRSSIVGGLFILLIFKTNATPEINQKIRKNLLRFSSSR